METPPPTEKPPAARNVRLLTGGIPSDRYPLPYRGTVVSQPKSSAIFAGWILIVVAFLMACVPLFGMIAWAISYPLCFVALILGCMGAGNGRPIAGVILILISITAAPLAILVGPFLFVFVAELMGMEREPLPDLSLGSRPAHACGLLGARACCCNGAAVGTTRTKEARSPKDCGRKGAGYWHCTKASKVGFRPQIGNAAKLSYPLILVNTEITGRLNIIGSEGEGKSDICSQNRACQTCSLRSR